MNLRFILLVIFLMGGGLSWPLKVEAEQPVLAQTDEAEAIASLPWQFFSSTSGKYIVDLPGTPVEQTSTSTLVDSKLHWQMSAVTVPAIDATDLFEYYLVAYVDIPRRLRYDYSQQELLDAAIATVVKDIEDKQLSSTLTIEEVAFQGLPSRLMTAEGWGQFLVATLSITGDRFYLVLAIDDDQANFEHFYNSFSVVP